MKRALLCLICLFILQWSTPFWWWIVVVPLLFGWCFPGSAWTGFRTGMLGAGVLWLSAALIMMVTKSALIAGRVAAAIGVGRPVFVLAAAVLTAALAGGFSGMTGSLARRVFLERKATQA